MKYNFVISCEHGGNQVPKFCQSELIIPKKVLNSHRGYDEGALEIAKYLARKLKLPLSFYTYSRLVIDYNRSKGRKGFYSDFSLGLSEYCKQKLEKDYDHYRAQFFSILKGNVIHLAIHSFTPILNGIVRNADIGLLYDPKREIEKDYAKFLKTIFESHGLKVRLNYPYKGISDGFTSSIRKMKSNYAGIEFELNQSLLHDKAKMKLIKHLLIKSIVEY